MRSLLTKLIFCILAFSTVKYSNSQISITSGLTPQQLLNVLVGTGVVVSNVQFQGLPIAAGSFNNGGTTNLGLQSGIILTSGSVNVVPGPNNSGSAGQSNNLSGDPHLQGLIPGYTVYDASVLTFDFIPLSDTIKFRYVFGSDEYPEYVNSSYNDVFGFFISGPNPLGGLYNFYNIARIPNTTTPVAINNVNNGTGNGGPCMNCQYYINNTGGATIQYDGFTTVLTAWALVTPCIPYSFKIAIGDAGDGILDSGVFLEENSFSTDAIQISTEYSIPGAGKSAIEGCNDAIVKFSINKFAIDTLWIYIDTIYGTATNGVDFPIIPNKAYILPGHNSGTLTISPHIDYITEGTEYITLVIPTSPCTIDTITIPILDYVPVDLTMAHDTLICETSTPLSVTAIHGAPPYSYIWAPAATLSNPNVVNPIASPSVTTTYYVTVKDTTACPAVSDSMVVTVSPKPQVSFMPKPFSGCEPLTVEFTDFSAPNIVTWDWTFGDGGTSNIKNPIHQYSAGKWDVTLTVTTIDSCKDFLTQKQIITVHPLPTADFDPVPPETSIDYPTINFNNKSTIATNWNWDFGEPSSGTDNNSTLQSPSHSYLTDGEFTVCLYVSTEHGCKDEICKKVRIIVDKIEIPNVITPFPRDDKNDRFYIKNIERLKYSKLSIYNRWGLKVAEFSPYDNSWDAEGHPDGVYFWTLEYQSYFSESEIVKKSGTLTVVRSK